MAAREELAAPPSGSQPRHKSITRQRDLSLGEQIHGLRHVLEQTEKNGVAIGHFNVSDLVLLKAIFEAAQELKVPVIVGLSEGERRLVGDRQIAALVRSLREEFDFPIFHKCRSYPLPGKSCGSSQSWV